MKLLEDTIRADDNFETLKESKELPSGVLRRIKGPLADYTKETRNGRRYKKELWENVLESDLVKEMKETKTFFGEADHPPEQEDRLEIELKQVSHHINDAWINENKGVVEGVIDILDTPNGRILDSLYEYGSKIGASSRGAGNVVKENGEQVVESDSYFFVTWDMVALPSNKPARLESFNEGNDINIEKKRNKVINSMKKQVEDAIANGDKKELIRMKNLIKSTENEKFNPLVEKLENSIKTGCTGCKDDNKIERLKEDLKEAHERIAEIKSGMDISSGGGVVHKINKSLDQEFDNLDHKLDALEDAVLEEINQFKTHLLSLTEEELKSVGTNLPESYKTEILSELNSMKDEVKTAQSLVWKLQNLLEVSSDDPDVICNTIADKLEKISDMNEEISYLKSEIKDLEEEVKYKNEILESYSDLVEDYTQVLCRNKGVDYSSVREQLPESLDDSDLDRVHSVVEREFKRQKRFKKLNMSLREERSFQDTAEAEIPERDDGKTEDRRKLGEIIRHAKNS